MLLKKSKVFSSYINEEDSSGPGHFGPRVLFVAQALHDGAARLPPWILPHSRTELFRRESQAVRSNRRGIVRGCDTGRELHAPSRLQRHTVSLKFSKLIRQLIVPWIKNENLETKSRETYRCRQDRYEAQKFHILIDEYYFLTC